MAHAAHHDHAPAAPRFADASGVVAWFKGLAERLDRWRLYRRTLAELSGLTDRELADLGMHRSTIHGIAWHAVYDR